MYNNFEYKLQNLALNPRELKKFTSFYLLLTTKFKSKLLFRGENYLNLRNKLNEPETLNIQTFSNKLFMIGEKAKIYHQNLFKEGQKTNYTYPIDSTEEKLFKYIFEKLQKIFKKTHTNEELKKFKRQNEFFCSYFKETKNKLEFIKSIQLIDSKIEQLKIRDYYISLLHRIGKIGIQNNSIFLSTTTNYNVARLFSDRYLDNDNIILIGWTNNKRLNQFSIAGKRTKFESSLFAENNLPTYNFNIYRSQKEISFKGGILPHYLLGYILTNKKEFHLNPALFASQSELVDIILDGFDIDQNDFENELAKTNYNGYFTLYENGKLEDKYPAHNNR